MATRKIPTADILERGIRELTAQMSIDALLRADFVDDDSEDSLVSAMDRALANMRIASIQRKLAIPTTLACGLAERPDDDDAVDLRAGDLVASLPARHEFVASDRAWLDADEGSWLRGTLMAIAPFFRSSPPSETLAQVEEADDPRIQDLLDAVSSVRRHAIELARSRWIGDTELKLLPALVDESAGASLAMEMP